MKKKLKNQDLGKREKIGGKQFGNNVCAAHFCCLQKKKWLEKEKKKALQAYYCTVYTSESLLECKLFW